MFAGLPCLRAVLLRPPDGKGTETPPKKALQLAQEAVRRQRTPAARAQPQATRRVVDREPEPLSLLLQRTQMRTAVILHEEHVLAIVPAPGHVVRQARDHDACKSWRALSLALPARDVKNRRAAVPGFQPGAAPLRGKRQPCGPSVREQRPEMFGQRRGDGSVVISAGRVEPARLRGLIMYKHEWWCCCVSRTGRLSSGQ